MVNKNSRTLVFVLFSLVLFALIITRQFLAQQESNGTWTFYNMKIDAFSDYGHIPENMRTFTGGKNKERELIINADKNSINKK